MTYAKNIAASEHPLFLAFPNLFRENSRSFVSNFKPFRSVALEKFESVQ